MNNLARFRADPSRVRVSIRPCGAEFTATVASRTSDSKFWSTGNDPKVAVDNALGAAERFEMEGIDLGMDWAYPHPMRTA